MSSAQREVDVVTLGESMVGFVSVDNSTRFVTTVAGAESNVASALAALGCRVRWVSRVGDDPLGQLIVGAMEERGVEAAVERDSVQPTGVLVRHLVDGNTTVRYYRRESAATGLGRSALRMAGRATWCHVTGITAAVSASAAELVTAVCDHSSAPADNVSFDVNYRPALWPDVATAAATLGGLARSADIVFVGDDESEVLFGTTDAEELADRLLQHDCQELVFKRGSDPASVITRSGVVTEQAHGAVVVDPTGAGDAFAAGYLAGCIFGSTVEARLRLAHFMAARAVSSVDDAVGRLVAADLDALAAAGLVPSTRRPVGD